MNLHKRWRNAFAGRKESLVEANLLTFSSNFLHQNARNPLGSKLLMDAHVLYFGHFLIFVLMDLYLFWWAGDHGHNFFILFISNKQTQFIYCSLKFKPKHLLRKILPKLISSLFPTPPAHRVFKPVFVQKIAYFVELGVVCDVEGVPFKPWRQRQRRRRFIHRLSKFLVNDWSFVCVKFEHVHYWLVFPEFIIVL